ncbi:MAG: hypothetical protein CMD74_02260 [Gammaproteobacteria bacterium]|nr:hypothetical protein [Gammaproteobacteria bacterium]
MPNNRGHYAWYLTSSSLWMAGASLQGFLFTWLIVGVLEQPADQAGLARSLAEFPPLIMLLVGGLFGDRVNGKSYLTFMHLAIAIPPLLIALIFISGQLNYWWVVCFGMLMAGIQSLSDPARQAVISRVAPFDIQRAVTMMVICTTLVGQLGVYIGGQLEELGLELVLVIQSTLFLLGIWAVRQLPDLPAGTYKVAEKRPRLLDGLKMVWITPLIRDFIGLNFISSLFNAGAYIIGLPFIVREVYEGGASLFALVMIIFSLGSIGSNIVLLFFMPLRHPGRLYLVLQLTRIVILGLLILKPSLWLFFLLMVAWGFNMGITSTLVRASVQELADLKHRSQILSVLLFSFIVSSPISSILLGMLITKTTPLTALVPGILISGIIFLVGLKFTGLWNHQSPSTTDGHS